MNFLNENGCLLCKGEDDNSKLPEHLEYYKDFFWGCICNKCLKEKYDEEVKKAVKSDCSICGCNKDCGAKKFKIDDKCIYFYKHSNLCIECEKTIVNEWVPEYCCDGHMCGCYGEPINYQDCVCEDCLEKLPQYTKVG